jgi:hypothetical protein
VSGRHNELYVSFAQSAGILTYSNTASPELPIVCQYSFGIVPVCRKVVQTNSIFRLYRFSMSCTLHGDKI